MLVYTISKGTNKSFVYDIYHGVQGEQGPQGEQGIQGPTGPQGLPGTAATIQVGSVTSGTAPSVTNVGTATAAVFDFVLEKGDQGPVGQSAGFGTPLASAVTLEAGASATASVVATGDATQKVFDFSFGIPAGYNAGFGVPTASASSVSASSAPTVSVSASGPDTAKVFDFAFGIPQGAKGDTGAAAGFGTPTASATGLPVGSAPTASVTASGADTAKVFAFNFGIPAGSDSWNIEVSNFTSNTMVLKAYKNGAAYTGSIFAYLTYGDGSTSQRTSSPMMLSASSGTITITSSEFPDIATVLADTSKTNFYFEFQETFTGSIFYSVSYVRGKVADDWEIRDLRISANSSQISFQLYKNGVQYTQGCYYTYQYRDSTGSGWLVRNPTATTGGPSWCNISCDSTYLNNPGWLSVTLFTDSNGTDMIGNFVVSNPSKATSIASGVKGYTTGDQVYTVVGNIETLLAAL